MASGRRWWLDAGTKDEDLHARGKLDDASPTFSARNAKVKELHARGSFDDATATFSARVVSVFAQ